MRITKVVLWLLLLAPLIRLVGLAAVDALGANPIERILRNTGFWTLVIVLVTLGVSPLRRLSRIQSLARVRRLIGLFAFFYGLVHLSSYVILDQYFDWPNMVKDIIKRPYMTVGLAALMLMVPLALTSTSAMQKRLGGLRWVRLHRMIYLTAGLGVIHFSWLVKKDLTQPFLFGAVFLLLMGERLVTFRRRETVRHALKGQRSL